MSPDPVQWVEAVRHSHDRLAGLVAGLSPDDLRRPSACSDWTVAQVLSHLGSQGEIFSLFVDAGVTGGDPPSQDAFGPIWDRWNNRSPEDQAVDSVKANENLVTRLEALDRATLEAFRLEMFGMTLDAAGLLKMRLSEHALHSWDVAVAFDDTAEVAGESVDLLIGSVGETAARSGKAPGQPLDAAVITTGPDHRFRLHTGDKVTLEPSDSDADDAGRSIRLPSEAFLRLVYGRLDGRHPAHGPVEEQGIGVDELVAIFPGF